MKLIFYDFEVFKYDWLVVLIDYDTREKVVIINDAEKLRQIYEINKDNIFCGFNSRYYDQWILKGILCDVDPYYINNELIVNERNGYQILPDCKISLNNYDCMVFKDKGLKTLEGFMGSVIKETDVPFDIDRKLTEDEIKDVVKYCAHDVEQTILVFENQREEFDSQLSLIQAFNLPMELFNKTKAQLVAHILGAERKAYRGDQFDISIPDTLQIEKYKHVVDWYKNPANRNYAKYLNTTIADVPHTFAWGGIHGSLDNFCYEGIILCCDTSSLYPSIIIEYNYMSRAVKGTDKYRNIRDTRLEYKRIKDPRQAPYKIVLNAASGCFKDEHNALYDPLMSNNVCIGGQLLTLDLIEHLEPYCKLVQSNTDGLFLALNSEDDTDKIKQIGKEWEQRTRLTLEWDVYSKLYQKDVNNYVIIDKEGYYKSKGGYVKKLTNVDYDLPIINKALINYFTKNVPIEDTINSCDDLREFQKIVKISRLYEYGLYQDKPIKEKVLRVFASNREDAGGVFKFRNGKADKLANTPEKCFIYTGAVTGVPLPEELDKNYYIDLANKRLDDFLHSKKKAGKNKSEIKWVNRDLKEFIDNVDFNQFESFIDLLVNFKENSICNTRQIKSLTVLNYFDKFGGNKKLLTLCDEFYEGKYKYVKINKAETKQKKIETLKEIEAELDDEILPLAEQMNYERDLLGYLEIGFDVDKRYMYVLEMNMKYSPRIKVYCLSNQSYDKIKSIKILKKNFNKQPFKEGDILFGKKFVQKPKSKPDPTGKKQANGMPVFIKDYEDKEYWLDSYRIVKNFENIV